MLLSFNFSSQTSCEVSEQTAHSTLLLNDLLTCLVYNVIKWEHIWDSLALLLTDAATVTFSQYI